MAELVLRLRDRELSRTPIVHTRITVGRDQGSDLVIDNVSVSRTHAVLIYVDKQFRIRDSESELGLTVNGKPTKDTVLGYGDVIGIGKFEVVLQDSEQAPPTQPKAVRPSKTANADVETLRPSRNSRTEGAEPKPDAQAVAGEAPQAPADAASAATDAAATPIAAPRPKAAALDITIILKIAAGILLLILAALGGTVWALENKWIAL